MIRIATMKWHCLTCRRNFQGPTDRPPADGCPHCGSKEIFDCNVEPLTEAQLAELNQAIAAGRVLFIPVSEGPEVSDE